MTCFLVSSLLGAIIASAAILLVVNSALAACHE